MIPEDLPNVFVTTSDLRQTQKTEKKIIDLAKSTFTSEDLIGETLSAFAVENDWNFKDE